MTLCPVQWPRYLSAGAQRPLYSFPCTAGAARLLIFNAAEPHHEASWGQNETGWGVGVEIERDGQFTRDTTLFPSPLCRPGLCPRRALADHRGSAYKVKHSAVIFKKSDANLTRR